MSWLSVDRAGDGIGYGEGIAIATVMVLMVDENHPKSQCYGFEQEMAVDEEKVVMVVAMEDRVVVGIACSSLDELLTVLSGRVGPE